MPTLCGLFLSHYRGARKIAIFVSHAMLKMCKTRLGTQPNDWNRNHHQCIIVVNEFVYPENAWTKNIHISSTRILTEIEMVIASLWPSGIGSRLGRNRLWVRFLAVSDIYPMFLEAYVYLSPFGVLWVELDTKIVLEKIVVKRPWPTRSPVHVTRAIFMVLHLYTYV